MQLLHARAKISASEHKLSNVVKAYEKDLEKISCLEERISKPLPMNSMRGRLPSEIEHRVHGWDLDPSSSALHCFPDYLRIIPSYDAELKKE